MLWSGLEVFSVFQVYAPTDQNLGPEEIEAHAVRAEAMGYDGLNIPEAVHDALLLSALALRATTRLKVATGVLVAFPRSPMVTAMASWDLQRLSGGRFELGLGTQVKGNIEGRYSTPWTAPVPRMREYVNSLRAIFASFQEGVPLDFRGESYNFTRLQPFFNPGPLEQPKIPISLGAVGPKMTALAGEVADRLITHPTNSAPRYIRETILPRLEKGAARAGRELRDVELMIAPPIATGVDEAAVNVERENQRELLAFLYSTPSYWPSLELFGWGKRGAQLRALTRENKWAEMKDVVDDEMLDAFVPSASYAQIAEELKCWYGELATRITFPLPHDPQFDGEVAKAIAALRG
jgi:probable F420-dependent oxidoreductase